MRVRAIDFVILNVSDKEKAKSFYRDTLGIADPATSEAEGWIEFDTKPVALALGVPPEGWAQKAGSAAIALAVDDVRAAVEELKGKGVEIVIDPMVTSACDMALVKDPDGNAIFLHRRHDGTAG